MTNEKLIELINELFALAEIDEVDNCVMLHSKRVGVWRFEQFAAQVRSAALMDVAERIDTIETAMPGTPLVQIGDVRKAPSEAIEGKV